MVDAGRQARLRVNPGGRLAPAQIVGRDDFIDQIWDALAQQSVVLTAERRMGKTSVLSKMLAEPRSGACAIKRSLQGVSSPDEFAMILLADAEKNLPGVLRRSLGERLSQTGVKSIGVSGTSVEFEARADRSWKDLASGVFSALDRDVDVTVVLLWDELPHMVANIRDNQGAAAARELLDLLRTVRETHATIRMVFSGSLGLHHVVDDLRERGGMWVPTHDMLMMDLPTLSAGDASYLAAELLRNESVDCDDIARVATAIAGQVDCAPYYVHHTVHKLMTHQRQGRCDFVDVALVGQVVDEALRDPLDPWQLQHYVDRVSSYYGSDADAVKAMLDVIALASDPPTAETIHGQIGAIIEAPPTIERLRDLLLLLCKDHYLVVDEGYAFRLGLIRRAWTIRRHRQS
jgi:hypothetical protein